MSGHNLPVHSPIQPRQTSNSSLSDFWGFPVYEPIVKNGLHLWFAITLPTYVPTALMVKSCCRRQWDREIRKVCSGSSPLSWIGVHHSCPVVRVQTAQVVIQIVHTLLQRLQLMCRPCGLRRKWQKQHCTAVQFPGFICLVFEPVPLGCCLSLDVLYTLALFTRSLLTLSFYMVK